MNPSVKGYPDSRGKRLKFFLVKMSQEGFTRWVS